MNKYLYWFLSLTWGIIMTTLGIIVTLILKCFRCKSFKNGYGLITTVGGNWGGLSLGPFAFCGRYNEIDGSCPNVSYFIYLRSHEFGHSLQNLYAGPLFIFIVAIPSAIRYWYYTINVKRGKSFPEDWYERAWFEHQATEVGINYISKIENN